MEKRCVICDDVKPLNKFHKASDRPDGYRGDCKICRKTKRRLDPNATKLRCYTCDELKDKTDENFHISKKSKYGFRRCCKECHKNIQRKSHLNRNYGITPEEYEGMLINQDYKCLICTEVKKLVVDHNHLSGEVRGLLCDTCNRGIGYLQESKTNLWNSILYLMPELENVRFSEVKDILDKREKKVVDHHTGRT